DFTIAEIEKRASVLSQKRTGQSKTGADVGHMDVGEDQDNDNNDDDEDDEDGEVGSQLSIHHRHPQPSALT
ncbi:hypothetical protein BGX24_010392, partial [Mortierella sp. AD032]